jgi:hypothetical protein
MICCFKTGTKFGNEYVLRLRDGVRRHSDQDLVCFTNDPVPGVDCRPLPVDLPKWWCKIGAYMLGQPLICLDLDIVILGSLQPLLEWQGFGTLKNPWLKGYNTSVIKLTGWETDVWSRFTPGVMATMRGDQDWLNVAMPGAATFPPTWFPSWKVHRLFTLDEPPPGAIACICHGSPRPHQITARWFQNHWTGEGLTQ